MRILTAISLAFITACASGGAAPSRAPESVSTGGSGSLRFQAEGARVTTLPVSVADVWRVLPAAYDSLGITLTDVDEKQHVLANSGMKVFKRLGTQPLSKYIDCGNTQGYPSADAYDVRLAITTQIDSAAAGTSISTLVDAVGRPVSNSGDFVRCSSRGELENRIGIAVKKLLY